MKTDKADTDEKTMVPLCTYGRDEKYITNKLWLMGISNVILRGVGDGMIPFVCLKKRIPCLLIFDEAPSGEHHQKAIEKFLIDKVKKLMEEATPGDGRFYRTNVQLNCCPDDNEEEKVKKKKEASKKKAEEASKKKADEDKKRKADEAPAATAGSSSSSSSSSSSKKSKKSAK